MPKYRKMLNDINAPYLQSLMRLIETQSKTTLAQWAIDYCEKYILPIYEKHFPANKPYNRLRNGPKNTLKTAREVIKSKIPTKNTVLNGCNYSNRELGDSPIAQAAARACGRAAETIHIPAQSLGIALYGALAIAYDKLGADADWEALVKVAAEECGKMEAALLAVAVENEPNPAKINWHC